MNAKPPARSGPPELALRVASAIVMIAAVLSVTWAGGIWFSGFFAIVSLLIFNEFRRLVADASDARLAVGAALALAVCMAVWLLAGPRAGVLAGLLALGALAIADVALSGRAWVATGFAYAFAPFAAMASLRGEDPRGLLAILFLFACVWAADTFAYFAGRRFGGPKLAPRISPRKTWSGFVGGLAGSVIVGTALLFAAGMTPAPAAVVVALGLSLVSQAGDLFESWVKRRFGKKDSGSLIPGHGGVLDRVDSLIFAATAAWLAGWAAGGDPQAPGFAGRALVDAIVTP